VALLASAAVEVVQLARHDERVSRADRGVAVAALAGAGAIVLAWPAISQVALLYVVGASAIALAIAETAALSTRPNTARERWLGAALSVVAFIFGIAMLARPQGSLAAAINLLGSYLIVIGSVRLVQALDAWRARRRFAPPAVAG
jgi:uncharacterized membrane protein HdeD (DUF308 family)